MLTSFADSFVIAHRLNTSSSPFCIYKQARCTDELILSVMDCDKIMVLDQGRVAEFASPAELLQDKVRPRPSCFDEA